MAASDYNIVWDPFYQRRLPPNAQTAQMQMPQANPLAQAIDPAISALVGNLASGGSAATASGAVAPMATQMPTSGLSSLASSGSTISSVAPALSTAAVIAMPFVLNKIFGGKGIQRPWNVNEVAEDMPGKRSRLAAQIDGYQGASREQRIPLLNKLHDAGLLALSGRGKVENGQLKTATRIPEYLSWGRFLSNPGGSGGMDVSQQRAQSDRWMTGAPSEDEIKRAYWLKESKRNELLSALAQMKALKPQQAVGASDNPLLKRI